MQVYALDKDYQMITPDIPYINLQWTRRYFEPGEFTLQVMEDVFNPDWAFIASEERPELAQVQCIEHQGDSGTVEVKGFFMEQVLDDKACFPRFIGSGVTEDVCRQIFTRYKGSLSIELAEPNTPRLGAATTADFSDDPLGRKLYSILETREMSMSVVYDHQRNTRLLKFWKGHDRTQGNSEGVPWYTFSTKYGNIAGYDVKRDWSGAKNVCIIPAAKDDNGKETITVIVDQSNSGERREIVLDKRGEKQEQSQSLVDFKAGLEQEGREKLADTAVVESIDIDAIDNGDYLKAYDLGDRCDVNIPALGISEKLRIIEVREVFKASGHEVSLEFGNNRNGGL